jgi:large subunit ribosomal protein L25
MADGNSTKLDVHKREPSSSRVTRRLRRAGQVPGVLYGGGGDPVPFSVEERTLRHALAGRGAVLELSLDGGKGEPAVLKDSHRHPVRGEILHIDLLRVDLTQPIHATVAVHLVGGEDAPGVKEGGILEHVTRELQIEALPSDIPEFIEVDVSAMEINATMQLSDIDAPENVTLLDDPDATVLASVTPPSIATDADDDIETETAVVGEAGEAPAAGEGEGETPADAGGDGGE